jgi:hypothetical protein
MYYFDVVFHDISTQVMNILFKKINNYFEKKNAGVKTFY